MDRGWTSDWRRAVAMTVIGRSPSVTGSRSTRSAGREPRGTAAATQVVQRVAAKRRRIRRDSRREARPIASRPMESPMRLPVASSTQSSNPFARAVAAIADRPAIRATPTLIHRAARARWRASAAAVAAPSSAAADAAVGSEDLSSDLSPLSRME
ncbi:hypothetical protein DVK44_18385 [Streptomyces paludis]|uniref:Uncharacterized protein n=1 Tax=Streptomyces paludis TaxID=2282738 RepID=A0A345HRH3_9ACTN|nr:hypothetical protein DVK44_18385 [Streptomyces paludis]